MGDENHMNVTWNLDRADSTNRPSTDLETCEVCGRPANLIVDEEHELCGVCAYRIRVGDLTRVRLFRSAVG